MSEEKKVETIDDITVKMGRLIRVKNTKKPKFSNAKNQYTAVWVEDANGKRERCLLFTQRELDLADKRAQNNPEDCPKRGWIQDLMD